MTIEKFCDLSKPWRTWGGTQLKNFTVVVFPVLCPASPFPGTKSQYTRAAQGVVGQQRGGGCHKPTFLWEDGELPLGMKHRRHRETGRSPLHLQSLLSPLCSLCLLLPVPSRGRAGGTRLRGAALSLARRAA